MLNVVEINEKKCLKIFILYLTFSMIHLQKIGMKINFYEK